MYLTMTETAARLRMCEKSVYSLVQQGMPCVRIGRRRMFNADRIDEWLEAREKAQCPSAEIKKAATTSRSASSVDAFTANFRRVQLRVMPSS